MTVTRVVVFHSAAGVDNQLLSLDPLQVKCSADFEIPDTIIMTILRKIHSLNDV